MKRVYHQTNDVVELSDEESTDSPSTSPSFSMGSNTTTNNDGSKLNSSTNSSINQTSHNGSLLPSTSTNATENESKRVKYTIVHGKSATESLPEQQRKASVLLDNTKNLGVGSPATAKNSGNNSENKTIHNNSHSVLVKSPKNDEKESTSDESEKINNNNNTDAEDVSKFSNFVATVFQKLEDDGEEVQDESNDSPVETPKQRVVTIHNIDKDSSVPLSEKLNDPTIIDEPKTNTFKCTKCNRVFQNKHGLFSHALLSTEHNPDNKRNWSVCQTCNQTYHPYSRHHCDKSSNDSKGKSKRKPRKSTRRTSASSSVETKQEEQGQDEQSESEEEQEQEDATSLKDSEASKKDPDEEADTMEDELNDAIEGTLEVRKDGFRCTKCDRTFTLRKGYWAHAKYSLDHDSNNRFNWKVCKLCAERYHPCGKAQHIKVCNPKNKQKNLELDAQLRSQVTASKNNTPSKSTSSKQSASTPSSSRNQNSSRRGKEESQNSENRGDEKWFCKKCNRKFNSKVGFDGHMNFSVEHDPSNRKNWKVCEKCLDYYHPYGKYRHDIGCKPLSKADKEVVLAKRKQEEAASALKERETDDDAEEAKSDEDAESEGEENAKVVPLECSLRYTAEIPSISKEQEMHLLFKVVWEELSGDQTSKILPMYNTISFEEFINALSGNFGISLEAIIQSRMQYKDEDGDWIDVDTQNDWRLGVLLFSRTLKKASDSTLPDSNHYLCMKLKQVIK